MYLTQNKKYIILKTYPECILLEQYGLIHRCAGRLTRSSLDELGDAAWTLVQVVLVERPGKKDVSSKSIHLLNAAGNAVKVPESMIPRKRIRQHLNCRRC